MRRLTVGEICERALRKIGAYPIGDIGAEPMQMNEARFWLDMVIGHITAKGRVWWLVEESVTFDLVEGQSTYTLQDYIGTQVPTNEVQFIMSARLTPSPTVTSTRELDAIGREALDAIPDKDRKGQPQQYHVDRLDRPDMRFWPVPDNDDYKVTVTFQKYAEDVTNLQNQSPSFVAGHRRAWNLFIVYALAAEIGAGPIMRLPQWEIDEINQEKNRLEADLRGFDMLEQPKTHQVHYTDF